MVRDGERKYKVSIANDLEMYSNLIYDISKTILLNLKTQSKNTFPPLPICSNANWSPHLMFFPTVK